MSRTQLLEMDKQRTLLEKEIMELTDYLNQDGWPGVNKSLIDEEGFPLPNLDLTAIREARNRLIYLQNDHKNLMLSIEKMMSEYFSAEKNNNQIEPKNENFEEEKPKKLVQVFEDDINKPNILNPFAYVSGIQQQSPAEEAGLQEGDGIYKFDEISMLIKNPLDKVANIVKSNENQSIHIQVIRGIKLIDIELIPHKWAGNGLLGCKFSLKKQ